MRPEADAGRLLRRRGSDSNPRFRALPADRLDLIDQAARRVRIVRIKQYRCILER
jgi:hypothetical protein